MKRETRWKAAILIVAGVILLLLVWLTGQFWPVADTDARTACERHSPPWKTAECEEPR